MVMLTFGLANKNISSLQHSIPTSNITWNVELGKKTELGDTGQPKRKVVLDVEKVDAFS